MLPRLPKIISSCIIFGCLSYVKADLKSITPNLDLGVIEANSDLVPLSWTISNSDNDALRLVHIANSYPHTVVTLPVGIIAPQASTIVHGSFNPRHTVGPIHGTLTVVAEHGPTVTLTFSGVVQPDIESKTELATIISNIDSQVRVIAGAPLIFATKSGNPIIPNTVSVHSASYVGANLEVVDDHLYVTPYIHVPSLPGQQRGHTLLTICFQHDIGTLTYDIPISWERNDPLRIIKLAPGVYAVSYTDHCRFKVNKLTITPGLTYKTHFSSDGTTLFLKPTKAKLKLLRRLRNSTNTTVIKSHHRPIKIRLKSIYRHQTIRINPNPNVNHNPKPKHDTNVLIQLETTHPYRSEVIINGE